MCGITGICSLASNTHWLNRDFAEAMTRRIAHRGPDGSGYHQDDQVILGHRRLSIIDLETGQQPIYSEDGDRCIVFNGEIYNYVELREQLIRDGYRFRTTSDTEVILHLYDKLGAAAVDELNGMFAFAIWTRSAQTLFIARDRFGEKPLYYWHQGSELLFASELKALLEHPLVPRRISQDALGNYLALGYVPSPGSIYEGIAKLPPASWLEFSPSGLRTHQYWDPRTQPADAVAIRQMSAAEMLSRLDSLIEESVRIRLRSDVPVGAFLSGGIDSSLIVHYASRLYEQQLQTFTIRFDERSVDESAFAAEVARRCGTDHHELMVGDVSTDLIPDLVRQFDEPFADPSSLPTYYVTRAASERLKVCLSGDAGDELFGGYNRYAPERFERSVTTVPLWLRQPVLQTLGGLLPSDRGGKGWLMRMGSSPVDRFLQRIWLFNPWEVAALTQAGFGEQISKAHCQYRSLAGQLSSRSDWPLLFDQLTYLPDDILVKADRNSMANSLELRVPLLDHHLAEFANALSLETKNFRGELKHPLKELARQHFPRSITDRRKQGFGLPLKEWFRSGPLATQFQDLLLTNNASIFSYLDRDCVKSLYASHSQGQRDLGKRLWALLWLELWLGNAA